MARSAHDDVLDALGDYIIANCTRITLCSDQPTTFAEANATFALADVTVDSGDFSQANGDVSGRKTTVAAQTAVEVDATGEADHVALLDVANSKLLYVTVIDTPQMLTDGNDVDIAAFDIEVRDPAAP